MFYVNNFELSYFYNYGYVSHINTGSDTQLILALQVNCTLPTSRCLVTTVRFEINVNISLKHSRYFVMAPNYGVIFT